MKSQKVIEMRMFLFEIEGMQLDFGETEYILICGRSNSNLCARLFPYISDARLRLKDLEDYIISPNYLALQDEDVVMLIQIFAWGTYFWTYTLGLMHGMFEKIEKFRLFKQANPESKKLHKYTIAGFMLPFKTFPEATQFYIRTPT
uniref:Uncharacterized protein n=1 Tax=Lactuca sativa TaxID=4236 RepID=A0A9R1X6T9_LACSA|nr:hypothetical protein LSAT_V11C600335860 [Lactuca sativa]